MSDLFPSDVVSETKGATLQDFKFKPDTQEIIAKSAERAFNDYGSGNFLAIKEVLEARSLDEADIPDNEGVSKLNPQQANIDFPSPVPGQRLFDRDVGINEARVIQELAIEKFERDRVLDSTQGFKQGAVKELTTLVALLLDPLSLATVAAPVAPVGLIARFGASRLGGAVNLAIPTVTGTTVFNAPRYINETIQTGKVPVEKIAIETGFATILGGSLGAFFKPKISGAIDAELDDPVKLFETDLSTSNTAQKTAVSQMLEGRPIEVTPVLESARVNNQLAKIEEALKSGKVPKEKIKELTAISDELIKRSRVNSQEFKGVLDNIPPAERTPEFDIAAEAVIKDTDDFVNSVSELMPTEEIEAFKKHVAEKRASLIEADVRTNLELKGQAAALNCIQGKI
jgi:hypothetical protein